MIEAIIFDVGGVLVRTVDDGGRRRWEDELGLEPGEAETIVFNSDMGQAAQRGAVTDEALWEWIGERLALSPERLQAFQRDFWAGDVLDWALVDLIRGLRPRFQTAIISNATDALMDNLTRKFPIAEQFDLIVGSAAEQIMKPNPAIFERALQRLGRLPGESVFVDDFVENVLAARALGMHAIHYRPEMDVAVELANLGVG